MLHEKLIAKSKIIDLDLYKCIFIGVTSSSHQVLQRFEKTYPSENFVYFDDYIFFNNNEQTSKITKRDCVLICDNISTGYLAKKIQQFLGENDANLKIVGVLTDSLDVDFDETKEFIEEFGSRLISILNIEIKKYRRKFLPPQLFEKLSEVIRINPYTNTPITFEIDKTFNDRILIDNEEFLKLINDDCINVGFKNYNNLIHPYFFNLNNIILGENEKVKSFGNDSILTRSFNQIKKKLGKEFESDCIKIFYPKKSDIKILNFNDFKTNIFKNNKVPDYQLERFNTKDGWKFPHLSDYYKDIIQGQEVIILDDGSCTGDSLIQMINEVSYFLPKQIYLICIVGRINDHKREFFSKISSMNDSISIEVFFSSYWHVPTFYLNNNPYSYEIKWLKKLDSLTNTPETIRKFASKILKEIEPKVGYKDYGFLIPNKKHNPNEIDSFPKKDMVLVREKIGRVIGYRYYKESFQWFNEFIAQYEDKKNKKRDRTKNIELLCMCILYEPYLFSEIKKVMPDVTDKICLFVETVIFGNPEEEYEKIIIDKHLFYDWKKNKKDFIHLFFIVFKDDDLKKFLNKKRFKELFLFADSKSDLSYILYKLTYYFINKNIAKVDLKIRELLIELAKEKDFVKPLRNYMVFVRTLPDSANFESKLLKLVENYLKVNDVEIHTKKKSFLHNISAIDKIIDKFSWNIQHKKPLDKTQLLEIGELWNNNSNFLGSIISFSRRFSNYLKPFADDLNDSILGEKDSVLSSMIVIDELIYHEFHLWEESSFEDLDLQEKLLDKILLYRKSRVKIEKRVVSEESDFYKIIVNNRTDLNNFIMSLTKSINSNFGTNFPLLNIEKIYCRIPEIYSNNTILKEIITNIKNHSDKDSYSSIKLFVRKTKENLVILIGNRTSNDIYLHSTGRGIKRYISSISKSELFDFTYKYKKHKHYLFKN